MARRCSTRSSLSCILRGRLVLSTPSTNKFARSRNLLMVPLTVLTWRPTYLVMFQYEHPFHQYPTTIPAICSITKRTIITSICRPNLVTVVLVSREQLWLWRSRCAIRNSVQIGWNCTYGHLWDRKLMLSFSDLHQDTHNTSQHTTL